ncbi:MAG: YaaR family protein [Oscillospiraceae bacterium]|nr:YaaR family protein [Oscillospiraceae bacterium]
MKISDFAAPGRTPSLPQVSEIKQALQPKPIFSDVIDGISRQNCNQKLLEMSREIFRQGQVLSERYDIADLKRYKRMLSEFMSEAVKFCYEFRKNNSRDRNGRHKMYAIVKKINQKLEKLTENILSQQVDAIQLIADIDEINGMVLDLFV